MIIFRCDYGWYGYPESGGFCKPCKCNQYGSENEECDEKTGQCNCKPGVTGWDCSRCTDKLHVLTEDGCTGNLVLIMCYSIRYNK
ncbi:hypothetical protein O3M35_004990 [Rhynocoris fuscipes]|uniref:Laminin EGF-like domain-containing protein n=1 Tax=Rhynocoris fuscipes TaxID=488301 RepID=A0AAW1DHF9_9HEMI